MAVSRHAARLIVAMVALCGAFALQRAEACFHSDSSVLRTECTAGEVLGPAGACDQSAAASTDGSSHVAEPGSVVGFDSDPSDDVEAPVVGGYEHLRAAGLPLPGRRSVPIASARRASRSARGPPATA